jgi:fructosamine-3-kinase
VLPWLRQAVDSHRVPAELARRVETLMGRLDAVAGPEPAPTLLHGDAQHHNFVSSDGGAVVIDASPCYGHPELDLALVDYFTPVPPEVFAAYREVVPIDPGFEERRELWRLFAYLGILAVDGGSTWGRAFADRLAAAVSRYV